MVSIAVLVVAAGSRLVTPDFRMLGALIFTTSFLVSWMLPSHVDPWWTEQHPAPEPPVTFWYCLIGTDLFGTAMVTKRAAPVTIKVHVSSCWHRRCAKKSTWDAN